MKKLFFASSLMLVFAGLASAQTITPANGTKKPVVKPVTPTAKITKVDKPVVKPTTVPVKATTVKPVKPVVVKPATVKPVVKTATPVKADGTPDMRFKVNKNGTKETPKGPLKADGTPDLRYKANKPKGKS